MKTYLHNGVPATDSRIVSAMFGRLHKNIIRDIQDLSESEHISIGSNLSRQFSVEESSYVNSRGKTYPMFILDEPSFLLLIMGFSTQRALDIKKSFIEEFMELKRGSAIKDYQISVRDEVILKMYPERYRKAYKALLEREHEEVLKDLDLPKDAMTPSFRKALQLRDDRPEFFK